MIHTTNCSLSIFHSADGDITHHHIAWKSTWCLLTFLMFFLFFASTCDDGRVHIPTLYQLLLSRGKWWVNRIGKSHMNQVTHTHTYTCLTAVGWAGTRKVKPVSISLKEETVSGIGISWAICKSAPHSRQITTPAPHHSVFYRPDALPAAQPTASKHWRNMMDQLSIVTILLYSVTNGRVQEYTLTHHHKHWQKILFNH